MSLGIFNRILNLLEDECRRLEGASFQHYLAALKRLTTLRELE